MGRKTYEAEGADRMNLATAEAARILTDGLAAYSTILQVYVHDAGEAKNYEDCQNLLETARGVVDSMAKLSKALAQVKCEMRQTIRVSRIAKSTSNAPQNAPSSAGGGAKKPSESLEKSAAPPPNPGGGG